MKKLMLLMACLTLVSCASWTGMSKEKISRIVTREVQDISLEDLEKISEVLDTPTWDFMRRAGENKGATSSTSDAPGNNKKAGHFND